MHAGAPLPWALVMACCLAAVHHHRHHSHLALIACKCENMHRLVRGLEELRRRVAQAGREKQAAEVAAAEQRGKADAERDALRGEVEAARQQAEASRGALIAAEAELRDYRARAQASGSGGGGRAHDGRHMHALGCVCAYGCVRVYWSALPPSPSSLVVPHLSQH